VVELKAAIEERCNPVSIRGIPLNSRMVCHLFELVINKLKKEKSD